MLTRRLRSLCVRGLLGLTAVSLVACSSDEAGDATGTQTDGGDESDPSAIESIRIPVGDVTFDARAAGPKDGEVVFLLHGFPETSYEWRHVLPVLGKAGFRAIAPDQRGYSPDARPTDVEAYQVPKLVQDVIGMADAVGAQRFHVVGHDWGAGVAWPTAVVAKDRVISLTAVSVPHPDAFAQVLADPTSCQYASSSYFDFFVTPAATDFFVNDDAAGLRATYGGLSEDDIQVYVDALGTREAIDGGLAWYRANIKDRKFNTPAMGPVGVPTLFVWSDADTYLCRAGAYLTGNFVDGPYRFEIIPGVNHWAVELGADIFDDLLLSQLQTYRERPAH
jgi:pimeloyl-ACP methyl ester carboxylesterase